MSDPAEDHRRLAFSIAYRMLGSVAEAEDIVQEALLRMHRQGTAEIENTKAYLATVVTRLAIDHLRSARVRRESYVGTWIPEPLIEDREPAIARSVEQDESVSLAFLLLLETLSPVERAVFLLREVFDYDYAAIAAIVEKSEDNCRKILTRARGHVEAARPRFEPSLEERDELARRFFAATREGALDDLIQLLASDAVFYGDGGGKALAVLNPVKGADRIARLLLGLFAKGREIGARMERVQVNGHPGILVRDAGGRLMSVMTIDVFEGKVRTVRGVVNPDKLGHLGPLSPLALLPRA